MKYANETEAEVAGDYSMTLSTLTENSRPHIANLTEIARDNAKYGHVIVDAIKIRLFKAPLIAKLPTLYLVDSIIKNHSDRYRRHFVRDDIIVDMFVHVFMAEREKGRASLFKLRQTWTPFFQNEVLLSLDTKVKTIDKAWPITAKQKQNTILVNPNFIKDKKPERREDSDSDDDEEIQRKAAELARLKREKKAMKKRQLELELEKTKQEVAMISKDLESGAEMVKAIEAKSSTTKAPTPKKSKETNALDQIMSESKKGPKIETHKSTKRPSEEHKKSPKKASREAAGSRDAARDRAKSRSPTITSNESTTPPPPPNIREDYKKSKKPKLDQPPVPTKKEKSFKIPKKRSSSPNLEPERSKKIPRERSSSPTPKSRGPVPPRNGPRGGSREPRDPRIGSMPPRAPMGPRFGPRGGPPDHFGPRHGPPNQHRPQFGPPARGPSPWQARPPVPNTPEAKSLAVLQNLIKNNPNEVLEQVVPHMLREARLKFEHGEIDKDSRFLIERQAADLREQALVQRERADKENQRLLLNPNGLPQGGPHGPDPRMHVQQPNFSNRDLPMASADDLDRVANDPDANLEIDRVLRSIRFYPESEDACVFIPNTDETHEALDIGFKIENDSETRIIDIDGLKFEVPVCSPNYTDFELDGEIHQIKIGAPSRELLIDGNWFPCSFGYSIEAQIGPRMRKVTLEGEPPLLDIGTIPRQDLCLGTIQLVLDGNLNDPHRLYLDLKPQRFDIDGKPHVFQFVDNFRTLLINGHPFASQFGGDPKEFYVNGHQHYFRLTTLPRGVRVGQPLKSREEVLNRQQAQMEVDLEEESQDGANLDRFINNQTESPVTEKPALNYFKNEADKNAEKVEKPVENKPIPMDFAKLFGNLINSGLIKGPSGSIPGLDSIAKPEPEKVPEKPEEPAVEVKPVKKIKWPVKIKEIIPIDLSNPDSIKTRQEAIIERLYDPRSMQCKSCGLRFPPNDMTYSKHLDWHFRMQKRKQAALQKSKSRKWFLELDIWYISNEIEEIEKTDDNADDKVEIEEIPTVPKSENPDLNRCPVCREDFEEIFMQEGEHSLHLHNAIRPGGVDTPAYHPLCYVDRDKIDVDHSINESIDESMEVSIDNDNEKADNSEIEDKVPEVADTSIKSEPEPIEPMETTETPEASQTSEAALETSEVKQEETDQVVDASTEVKVEDAEVKEEVKDEPTEDKETTEAETSLNDSENLGNLTADAGVLTAPSFNVGANIKFNIKTQGSTPGSPVNEENGDGIKSEPSEDQNESKTKEEESEFDPESIIQERSSEDIENPFRNKPKLKGRKLTEFPPRDEGRDLSGLCSIM